MFRLVGLSLTNRYIAERYPQLQGFTRVVALVRVRHLWVHRAFRHHPQHSPHPTVRPQRRALAHHGRRRHTRHHGSPLHNLLDNGVLPLAKTKAKAK